MSIRAVIFDIGGVLLTLGDTEYHKGMASRLGLDIMPDEYQRRIPALQRGEESEEQVGAELVRKPVPIDAFDALWLEHFRPVPAMLTLAGELRVLGLRTAVLSNTQASHVRLMRSMGFLHGFDPVVMSCEVGCRKPEPEAFQHVLDRLGLPADSVAYVDDNPEYVKAAAGLGIKAILHEGDASATRRAIMELLDEPRWEPLGETLVLDGYWKVTEGRFRLPDGSEIARRLIQNRHPAMVLCLNDQNQVLLIRQYRAPFHEVMWEPPGGDADEGETIEEAAARECEEETGYRPLHVKHVLTSRASPGESDAEFHICIARGVAPGRLDLGTDEQIQHYWVDLKVALDLARQGFIRHPGVLLGLLYLAVHPDG